MTKENEPLLEMVQLQKQFVRRQGLLRRQTTVHTVVDGVTLAIAPGETVCLVGESGAGKTMLARTLLQLEKPTGGSVLYRGRPLETMSKNELRQVRQHLQLLFPDPYKALSPHDTVGELVGEPLQIHGSVNGRSEAERVAELLQLVELNPYMARRYPHEFSGGQRQRMAIARALATEPELLVADDPIVALDPVVQPPLLHLLRRLQAERGLAILLLTRQMAAARLVGDRVGVLLHGRMVELAAREEVWQRPLHPYTQVAISQLPLENPQDEAQRHPIELRSATAVAGPLTGCQFHPRCPYATDLCRSQNPELRNLGRADAPHWVACHYAEQFI